MDKPVPFSMINSSRIPVVGVGGLGLVAMVGVMAGALPLARVVLGAGLIGGVILGVGIIVMRRRQPFTEGTGPGSTLLFPQSIVASPRIESEEPPARPQLSMA